jgi:hypothetical protein
MIVPCQPHVIRIQQPIEVVMQSSDLNDKLIALPESIEVNLMLKVIKTLLTMKENQMSRTHNHVRQYCWSTFYKYWNNWMRKQSLWRAQFNGNKDMELSYIFFEEGKLVHPNWHQRESNMRP